MKFRDLVEQILNETQQSFKLKKLDAVAGGINTNSGIYKAAATGTSAGIVFSTSSAGNAVGTFSFAASPNTGSASSAVGNDYGWGNEDVAYPKDPKENKRKKKKGKK